MSALGVAGLGLDRGKVVLVESDPLWPSAFERFGSALRDALPEAVVEHVGSTAVAGLRAKPILDVAVGVVSPDEDDLRNRLEPLGFVCRGDAHSDGGLLFVLEDRPGHRVAPLYVHVVELDGKDWCAYLAFRERLRRDPAACAAYVEVKEALAARFPHDRESYTAGKHDFIAALLAEG